MKPQPTKADQAYFDRNADVLGAMGWHGYLRHGRGAVVVQNVGDSREQMVFLPQRMLVKPLCEALAGLVGAYSPLREVVVIFIRPSFSITAYKGALPGRETPPEAYERLVRALFGRPDKGDVVPHPNETAAGSFQGTEPVHRRRMTADASGLEIEGEHA